MIDILFMGTPDFACSGLQALIDDPRFRIKLAVTQPDRPAGRGKMTSPPPVKKLAERCSIPVLQVDRIKSDLSSFVTKAREHGPFHVGIVIAFGQILPFEVLTLPEKGCLNVHASLLPRWRGAAPIQRAIMAGDTRTGLCLMQMEKGLDTGPIYVSTETPITSEDTFGSLHDRLATMSAQMLRDSLEQVVRGAMRPVPQPETGATYAKMIDKQEAHIDWHSPAAELSRQIRGLSPFPGAFTTLHGKRLKILNCTDRPGPSPAEDAVPGSVLSAANSELEVQCGSGTLLLSEVQLEGRSRMMIPEFLAGNKIMPLTVLGQ